MLINKYFCSAVDAKERQQWVDRLRVTSQHHTEYMSQVSFIKILTK